MVSALSARCFWRDLVPGTERFFRLLHEPLRRVVLLLPFLAELAVVHLGQRLRARSRVSRSRAWSSTVSGVRSSASATGGSAWPERAGRLRGLRISAVDAARPAARGACSSGAGGSGARGAPARLRNLVHFRKGSIRRGGGSGISSGAGSVRVLARGARLHAAPARRNKSEQATAREGVASACALSRFLAAARLLLATLAPEASPEFRAPAEGRLDFDVAVVELDDPMTIERPMPLP